MKHFIFLLMVFCLNINLYAQRQKTIVKVGCIDMQKIIDTVSADKLLKRVLENQQKTFLKEAKLLSQDIKNLKAILAKGKVSEDRRQEILYEINSKQEQLQDYLNQKSRVLRSQEQILTREVLINIYNIIKKVSIKEGFTMILEKGSAVVYAGEEVDITLKVIEELREKKRKLGL